MVATEYHATPALVESSKTRSDSQSFAWLPVIAAAKESFLISQWSFLEQNWVALSPISEMAALIRGRYRLRESLTQSLTSENDRVVVELPETKSLMLWASSITATTFSSVLSPVMSIDLEFTSRR